MFTEALEKSKFEHNELRDELKKMPLFLNIPPLKKKWVMYMNWRRN